MISLVRFKAAKKLDEKEEQKMGGRVSSPEGRATTSRGLNYPSY